MTPDQMLATAMLQSARENLRYARLACEALPGGMDVMQRLAKAVEIEQVAEQAYEVAMTAALAVQIEDIVPDAFPDTSPDTFRK